MNKTIRYPTPINEEKKKEVTSEQEAKKTNETLNKQVVRVTKSKSKGSPAVSEQWHRYFYVYPHQAARIRMQQNIKEGIAFAKESVSYRMPMPVLRARTINNGDTYSLCPRCDNDIEREYMLYCNCCGQCLDWSMLDYVRSIKSGKKL